MPRLPPTIFRHALSEDPLLAKLLPICRSLASARNELRWLRDFAINNHANQIISTPSSYNTEWRTRLRELVMRRGQGEPLQYILGTEFFGDLELVCRPGVLIPRPDTAAAVSYLTRRIVERGIQSKSKTIRVLDLCTGSGCISLLFQHEMVQLLSKPTGIQTLGVDLSAQAIALASLNRDRLLTAELEALAQENSYARNALPIESALGTTLRNTEFVQADILDTSEFWKILETREGLTSDILLCNPPYISRWGFYHTTERSVRRYEPKMALVPTSLCSNRNTGSIDTPEHEDLADLFYEPLVRTAQKVEAKVVWFEVADIEQAARVAHLISSTTATIPEQLEIWREVLPRNTSGLIGDKCTDELYRGFAVKGRGNGRSVVWWRHA